MRDLPQLKSLFRKNIKVTPGGPPVGTPGSNRAEGVLNSLDALAEEVKDIDAYTKQEVDYLLDGQIGYLPDLPTVAKNNIVSSIRELSRQKVSIAALAPSIGLLAYFASYAEAEQYALSGDTIYLSGTHASISVAKSISLHGGNIKELTVGYRTGPLAVNVAGALCGGRIVTCVPTTNGGKHTVTYTNILTGPATFFEQFGLEGGNGAWADVTISQTRLHNRGAYIASANGVPAGGCVRWQERGGRYSRYTVLDSTLRSDNNADFTGYPDAATKAILAGSTDVQPGAGRGVQETMLLNSGVVQPDADILVEQRTASGGGSSGFLQGAYTVQEADVTSPASDLVIAVPNATSFGQVGVSVPGVSGQDMLTPGTDYTSGPGSLTILAGLNPPLQAGYEVHYAYLFGTVQPPTVAQPPRHVLVTTPNSRFNDLNLSGEVTFTGGLLNNVSSVKAQILKGGATAISQPRAGSLSDVLGLLNSDVASLTLAERLYYTIRFQTTPALQANVAQLTLDTTLSGGEFEAVPPHATPFLAYSNGGTGPPPGFGGPVPGESFEEDDSRWIMETGSAPTIGRDPTWSMGQVYLFNSVDANNPTTVRGIEFFANGVLNVNAGDTVAMNYLLRLYQQDRVTLLGEYNVVTTRNQFGGRNGVALTIAGLPPQVYYMRVVSTSAGFMCLDNYQLV